MSIFVITQAVVAYESGITQAVLTIAVDVPTIGQTFVGQSVSLNSADLCDDWTDAQLCEAVATKLNVPVEDVSVAVRPEPVAPPEPPAPVIDGEGDEVGGAPVYNPVVGGV